MSRSWTERLRPKARLGLRFARDEVFAAQILSHGSAQEVVWAKRALLPGDWLVEKTDTTVIEAVRELCIPAHGRYVSVQVGLPDPLFVSQVFALDALPRSRQAQCDLAAWRLKKEFDLSDDIQSACQVLGQEGTKALLLGIAGPKTRLMNLCDTFKAAKVTVRTIDTAMRYRFNTFHDRITRKGAGALIALDRDAWSVCIWDEQARARFFGSRWREAGAEDLIEITEDIERIIRGYVNGLPGRVVEHLFVTGAAGDSEALFGALRARTNGQCEHIAPGDAPFSRARGGIGADPGALAVAAAS